VAVKSGLSADILSRKGGLTNVVESRDRFIREAVLEQDYLASQVADLLLAIRQTLAGRCRRVSRLGKSDTCARLAKSTNVNEPAH